MRGFVSDLRKTNRFGDYVRKRPPASGSEDRRRTYNNKNTFDSAGEPIAIDSRGRTSIDAKLGTKHCDEEARRGEESASDQVGQSALKE
jgi:hypothetical protein